jgi:hypothetical protein
MWSDPWQMEARTAGLVVEIRTRRRENHETATIDDRTGLKSRRLAMFMKIRNIFSATTLSLKGYY